MRIEFLELVRRNFLFQMSIHRSSPIQKLPNNNLSSVAMSHLEDENNELPASTVTKLLKFLLKAGTISPTYAFSLIKSSLLSSTDNYSEYRKVGAFRKPISTASSSILPSPFTSPHTVTQSFYPEPTFQLQCDCRREQSLVPHTMPMQAFMLLPSQACIQPLFLLHLQKTSE